MEKKSRPSVGRAAKLPDSKVEKEKGGPYKESAFFISISR
jgi:hypothetical protein